MKKLLSFALVVALCMFVSQSWATEKDQGHPWEGDKEEVLAKTAESDLAQPINKIVDVLNSDLSPDQKATEIAKVLKPFDVASVEGILNLLYAIQTVGGDKTDDDCMRCINAANRKYCSCLGRCDFFDEACRQQCSAQFIADIIACKCNWMGAQMH